MQGWTYGEKKDVAQKTTPYLVPWDHLPENIKQYDVSAIKNLPQALRDAGLEIYRIGGRLDGAT